MADSAPPPLTHILVTLSQHWHKCRGRLKTIAAENSDTEKHRRENFDARSAVALHPFPDFLDRIVLSTGIDKEALKKAIDAGFSNCQVLVADVRKLEGTLALNQLYEHLLFEAPDIAGRCGIWPSYFGGEPACSPPDNLTEREKDVLEAVGAKTLIAEAIAKAAGYPNNSAFRTLLSNLVKRGHLEKGPGGKGYRRPKRAS